MRINVEQAKIREAFKSRFLVNSAVFLDERVLMNKAVLDASVDVPIVLMANNKTERRERINKAAVL